MEKPQSQQTTGILNANQITAASALTNFNAKNIAFDEDGFTRSCLSNRRQPGSIFIAKWQVKKKVLNREKIDPLQFLSGFSPYPTKRGDRSTMKRRRNSQG
jgi:hypothetical protein